MKTIALYLLFGTASLGLGWGFAKLTDDPQTNYSTRQIPTASQKRRDTTSLRSQPLNQKLTSLRSINRKAYDEALLEAQPQILLHLFEELAASDPLKAKELLESADLSDQEEFRSLYSSLAYHWSQKDPYASYQWLSQLQGKIPYIGYQEGLIHILGAMSKESPQDAFDRLNALPDPDDRATLIYEIAENWAALNYDDASAWFQTLKEIDYLEPSRLNLYQALILRKLIETDPDRAAEEIVKLDSKQLQTSLVEQNAPRMALKDLNSAYQWLQEIKSPEARTEGLSKMVFALENREPRKLVDLFLNQEDPEIFAQNRQPMKFAFEGLATKDPRQSEEILLAQPPARQLDLASAHTFGLLNRGEEEAQKWIDSQKPGPILDGAASVMAEHSFDEDPTASLTWATRVSDPDLRGSLIRRLAIETNSETLPSIQTALKNADLSPRERQAIDLLIEERMSVEFTPLVLPVIQED